ALAIKNGVPALVIDSVAGGHKVSRQARTIGWPVSFIVDEIEDKKLQDALAYCLTLEARQAAAECGKRAKQVVERIHAEFVAEARKMHEVSNPMNDQLRLAGSVLHLTQPD